MNKKKILTIITSIILISLLFTPLLMADPDNVISFLPVDIHLEMGQNTTMNINATINDPCDTVAVDNLTFNPSVVTTDASNVTGGNLFENGTIDPIVYVNNATGYINSIVWSNETLSAGTTGTLANITWYGAGVGVSEINMTAGGTAYDGTANATTNHSCNITVHPQHPLHMDVNTTGTDTINISWTSSLGADNYTIEYNTTVSTWARGDSVQIANVSSDTLYFVDHELDPDTTYYYQIWSYNSTENLYSLYNNSGSNTTDPLPTIDTEVNLYGLTDTWNITIENTSFDATPVTPNYGWCNSSGIRNETMEVNLTVNTTSLVEWINVSVNDLYDGTHWSNASNVTVYYSPDNFTWLPIQDDDGNGFGVGVDGGNNLTINSTTFYYTEPNPLETNGDGNVITSNCSIYLRFKYEYNISTMDYGTYHNQTGLPWKVWIGATTDIYDHADFTMQVYNRDESLDMYNFYPANNSFDLTRPPTNFSAYISGTDITVYFNFINMTGLTNVWETFTTFDAITNERVEFNTENVTNYGTTYEFIWGNTSYTWSVNITDGLTWQNRTLYFHTYNKTGGDLNARRDTQNDNDVDIFDCIRVYNWYNDGHTYNRYFDIQDDADVDIFDAIRVYNEYN